MRVFSRIIQTMEPDMTQLMYDVNKTEALKRLPVIILLALLSIIGIIGNIHVWYIYKCRFKTSTYRVFVLFMAIIDIMCCFVAIPFEVVDELFPFAYMELISCKIFRFISTCIAVASVFMLVVISFERYGKVCKPDEYGMSESSAIFSSVMVLIASVVFTFPAIYVYGRKTITDIVETGYQGNSTENVTVTGYECTWGDNIEDTLYFRFYHAWVLLTIVGSMGVLVVVYSLIWLTLKRNVQLTRRYSECQLRPSPLIPVDKSNVDNKMTSEIVFVKQNDNNRQSLTTESSNINTTETIENGKLSMTNGKKERVPNMEIQSEDMRQNGDRDATVHIAVKDNSQTKDRKSDLEGDYSVKGQLLRARLRYATSINETELPVTKVMFALSLLFIGCCVPYIVCLVVYLSNFSYSVTMPTPELVLYLVGSRLYLMNSVVKSVVYGCLDRQFRTHLVKFYHSVFDGCKNFVSQNPK